ncbi:fatty acyl-CoA reductase 2, chloroplastic-like isoform X2 [Juglans microcarpa x Juglans regia]|uniref:fatty acyl-CoA reductase 2, chloroplastic-like isoform X2 n=1 Tax=Juglans microcarpa x Juglans regia TaxID=2249226 RepID=UPI001B7E7643|nr:fatty acyl-CoA reductase 2, chloroplastic-like isoform X2 [Juglans microcarpa x Juglans regia]
MEALRPNSFSLGYRKVVRVPESEKQDRCSWKRWNISSIGYSLGSRPNASKSLCRTSKSYGVASVSATASLNSNPNNRMRKIQAGGGTTSTLVKMINEDIGVVNFLRGKNFFITGATGFLAKVLIEKILRAVPDVGKIFVLIRAKNKESANERLQSEIINAELFKCLRQIHGKSYQDFMLSKLVTVVGDVREHNLGLDAQVADLIRKEANIIVNSAATTDFRERYDVAVDINIRGPCLLMSFAKTCKKLELFLHISTAYVHGVGEGIFMEESLRKEATPPSSFPTLDINLEMKLALDSLEDFKNKGLTRKMKEFGLVRARKHGWKNTYSFTKAMGEMVLMGEIKGDLPMVIVRPSVIESTYKEPFPGCIEGIRMMDSIISSYGKGQLTGFPIDLNGVVDIVPADMVVNATLAAITRHGMAGKGDMNIYHVASSVANPLLLKDHFTFFSDHFISSPWIDSEGRPTHVKPIKMFGSMDEFSAHISRDTIQQNSNGKLPQEFENSCRKLVERAKYLANIYEPYMFYPGRFVNSNAQRLMESMSEEEKRMFGFDVRSIDWKDYILNVHIPGLRTHAMNEKAGMSN